MMYSADGYVAPGYTVGDAVSTGEYVAAGYVDQGYADGDAVLSLTQADIARIVAALPSASDIAAALLAALNATTIPVDARKMNGATVTGDGSIADPWRGVGVPV